MSEALVKTQNHSLATLTPKVIKELICKNATDQEVGLFFNICKNNNLDPFKREAYLIKHGTYPATTVTGYEVYLKRAQASGKWNGFKIWTEGSLATKDLVAKCEVYRKDWDKPFYWEVDYLEGLSPTNPIAKTKPKHMLKKTCLSQAFRLVFPDEVGGLPYTADEMGQEQPVSVDYEVVQQPDKPKAKAEPKPNPVEVKQTAPVPTEPELPPYDIHKDKYGGMSPHKDKLFVDVPLGYLKSLTKPEYWDKFPDRKKQGILDTIAYLSKKEKEAETVAVEEVDDAPIGELTPTSTGYVEPKDDLVFDDKGEVSTQSEEDKAKLMQHNESKLIAKLDSKEWEIDPDKKGDDAPPALVQLVVDILENTTLLTPIEKERMFEAITKLKRNMAIAQYNQLKVVLKKRFKAQYGE